MGSDLVSAIAGLWRLDGRPAAAADIASISARLAHRGPDGAGTWAGGSIALAHRLLHSTPESLTERHPIVSRDRALVLVADARIDNRDELREALELAPAEVQTWTDAEWIMGAYRRWQDSAPEHLLGDFAFALWDARRQVLFCARDHFGVKPFYYHHVPGRLFAFASEIKGLLALAEVPRRLNETRVADYLASLLEDKESTFYEGILRLAPAHQMIVSRDGVRRESYWALDPEREIRLASDAEYAEAFREVFTEAVRSRLRSAFPVGSMLSGGLDSSSIVCVARQLLAEEGRGPLHAFSAVFDNVPESDERPYMEAVLAQGGLNHDAVRGDLLDPIEEQQRILEQQDEPYYAPNLFLHWGLYRKAQERGVRVLLDGLDGDSTVSHAIGYLGELARTGRWWRLAQEIRGLSRNFGRSPWVILKGHAIRPLAPDMLLRAWRAVRPRKVGGGSDGALLDPDFGRRMGVEQRLREERAAQRAAALSAREFHYQHLTQGIIPLVLEVADRAAAAASIEPRYPFFDRRLAELCLAMPADQKLRDGWTRRVMRNAMDGILPPAIRWRGGKANLSPNFIQVARRNSRRARYSPTPRRGVPRPLRRSDGSGSGPRAVSRAS